MSRCVVVNAISMPNSLLGFWKALFFLCLAPHASALADQVKGAENKPIYSANEVTQ